MGRAEHRIAKKLEINPIYECNKIKNKYCPKLFEKFKEVDDPRHQGYIEYSTRLMLGTIYYKGIAGITSVQEMTHQFNDETVAKNMRRFLGETDGEYLPHGVTINEFTERVAPIEIQKIQQELVYDLIRRKTFDDGKFQKKWLVIVDGTQMYSGSRKLNEKCLERHYNKGTDEETVNYHNNVLEAKIYFGEKLIVSIGSEFIENNGEDAIRQKKMTVEQIKQDCEMKAFTRLAEKIHNKYPRLPIIMMADSLYASKPVMDICSKYGWDYIIRYKKGSIPSISEEYEAIPEKEKSGHAEYINGIDYREEAVNMLKYWDERTRKGEVIRTKFQWITSLKITKKNAEKIAHVGRLRWKIENEGFNRQKNWQNDITHACSWNANAIKIYYLMLQISDMIKQLYEWFFLKKNGIIKKQKNISSELLASFTRRLIREDISLSDIGTQSVSIN